MTPIFLIPDEEKEKEYALKIQNIVDCLPTCFLVHNGSLFIGDLVTPEEASPPDEGTYSEKD